tara:strand:- start:7860 stop:14522 length:6663 start_codon:yes stop_codon:yes gene_type:complete
MSLSCKTDLFCEIKKDSYYVKVIYNRFDSSGIDLEKISDTINDIHTNIAKEIDNPDKYSSLIDKLEKNYMRPRHMKQIKYIFLGEFSEDIKKELDKISKNVKDNTDDSFSGVNTDLLYTTFEYRSADLMIQDWDIKSNLYEDVIFVPFYISKNETVKFLYHILGHYCNNNPYNDIFNSQGLYIYGAAINVDPTVIEIQSRIIEDSKIKYLKYTSSQLKTILESYLVPSVIIEKLLVKYESDNIHQSLIEIINHPCVIQYLRLYAKYQNIRYVYQKVGKMTYPIDSDILTYLDPDNVQYKQKVSASIIRLVNMYENKILYSQYAGQNTFYMYNYYNIGQELIKLQILSEETKERSYVHFISKFFPNIAQEDIINYTKQDPDEYLLKDSYTTNNLILTKYSKIAQSYNQYIPNPALLNIGLDKFFLLTFRHKLILPKDFDIRDVFNGISLNFDIPFVKFRDIKGSKEIIYKIFKPITEKITFKYKPLVSKEELDEWIRYKSYEFENDSLRHIKNNPKEISYKIKLTKVKIPEKLNGTIFKINEDNTYDIELSGNIIREVPKEFIINNSNLNITDSVVFHNYKIIYLDVDISKKGYMQITIDIRMLNDLPNELSYIMDKVNIFKSTLFSIDSLQSYTILNPNTVNVEDVQLYNNTSTNIDNVVYSYKFKVPHIGDLKTVVNLDFLEKTATQLYPFVRIQEKIYKINDPILYYDETRGVYIKGLIKNYSLDNTYDIDLMDPDQGVSQLEQLKNVPKLFIKSSSEPEIHQMFELNYIKVSDYDDFSPIQTLLTKFEDIGLEAGIKLTRIMEMFMISKEEALDILNKGDMKSKSSSSNRGIIIKIDYIPHLYSETEEYINIYIENVKSINQIKEVYFFIHYFFELYYSYSKQLQPRDYFNYFFTDESDTKEIELKKIAEATKTISVSIEKDQLQDIDDEFSDDDMDEWSDDEDDGIDEDEDDLNYSEQKIVQDTIDDALSDISGDSEVIEGEIGDIDESKSSNIEEVTDPEYLEQIKVLSREIKQDVALSKATKNTMLDKMYALDPILFHWSISDKEWGPTYAAACQGSRQPKILTDSEKIKIDEDFKKQQQTNPKLSKISYATSPDDIDCSKENIMSLKKSEKIKCKALKWGSSSDESSHYWYICPKIIELNSNTPLNVSDLEWGVAEEFESTEVEDPSTAIGSEWRTDKTTGKDILEFKPSYKGKYPVLDDNILNSTLNNSLLFLQKKENRTYPGFMNKSSHPLNLYFPCCFKDNSARIRQAFGTQQLEIDPSVQTSDYVQNWGKHLSHNPVRFGLLPIPLLKIFNHNMRCVTGPLKTNIGCFLLQGVDKGPNNFFSLIADIASNSFPNGTTSPSKKISDYDIKDHILKTLTYDKFRVLNNGNLYIQFQYLGKQSSFQNYLEYTISNQNKNMEFYYEYLTEPSYFLPNGLRLIIIDYNSEDDTYKMLCPYFSNQKLLKDVDTAIVLKHNDKYTPIYQHFFGDTIKLYNRIWGDLLSRYKNSINNPEKSKTSIQNTDRIKHFVDKDLIEVFDTRCITSGSIPSKLIDVAKIYNKFILDKNYTIAEVVTSILDSGFKIKYFIRDQYNKITGIYLDNEVVVPVYPQVVDNHLYKRYLIKELNDIEITDLDKTIRTYNKLKKDTSEQISIHPIKYIEDSDMIIGFISNIGVYIPIQPINSSDIKNLSRTKSNYFEIDKKLNDYRIAYENSIYKSPFTLSETIDIINNVYSKYSKEEYLLNNIVLTEDSKEVIAISFNCGIYVEVIKEKATEEIKSKYTTTTILELNNIDYYLTYSIELSRISDYKILCLPVRGNMDNSTKRYTSIILETGLEILLFEQFYIYNTVPGNIAMYIIEKIIEEPLIDQIFGTTIINKPLFIDERIQTNEKIKYVTDIYNLLTTEFISFLQVDTIYSIKEYLLSILLNPGLSSSTKKILIKPIIGEIFNSIIESIEVEDINDYPTIQSDTSCITTKCKLPYCDMIKLSFKKMDSIDSYIWKGYSEFNSDKPIDETIVSAIVKELELDIVKTALDNYNKLIVKLNSEIKTYCKIQIIDNTEKNRILRLQNRLFNEIVYNQFKRNQLFYYFKKKKTGDRFTVNVPFEILMTSTDYNISKLNTLYHLIRQKYYNKMIPFDEIHLDISINMNVMTNSVSECAVSDSKKYKIIQHTTMPKHNLNKNSNSSLIVPLNMDEYKKLFYKVMELNIEQVKYPVKSPIKYKIINIDQQKQLL